MSVMHRIERRAIEALREEAEDMALTDAASSRSTSRRKSKAQRAADTARADAFCEALYILGGGRTPFEVRMRLREEAVA